jgi:superfamily II DNA or RNA helicase
MKCTLVIKDEVNVHFKDVDPKTRRKLNAAVEFFLPHAMYMPAYKLGRWNGKVSFCDVAGRSYFQLLDRLLPIVVEAGYEVEVEDHRTPYEFNFEEVEQDSYDHVMWPKRHPNAGEPIILRDYQCKVINQFLKNPQSLAEVATGAGKTLITAVLSQKVEHLGRSMVIVPNKDLVTQTERDYINMGLDVGVYFGDRKEFGKTHTICTWQSLAVLEKATKKGEAEVPIDEFVEDVVLIMVDEVHKAKADVLRDQLSGMFRNVPLRWGLTGTVPKDEHEATGVTSALGPVIGSLSSKELQDMGVLAKLDINIFQMKDAPLGFAGYAQELKWLTTDPARISEISNMIKSISGSGNTLVLIDRIATGDMFKDLNPDWVFVSGKMKTADRQDEYDEVSETNNKVIVATYGVAAVGINIPRIFNLVMIEPGKSFVRVIQSIGRGIRKAEDKDYVAVYDITSDLKYSKRHLTKRKAFYAEKEFKYNLTKLEYK